jgi:uncharacterized protein YbbK (DUF523 family)/uncharacterized protein YbgA (DUF1722 family)
MSTPSEPLRLGISACLLGERVRYDGGDKRAALLCDALGGRVEWVPICPEVEVGLGTPRPPMILRRSATGARLWTPSTGADHTVAMRTWAEQRVGGLGAASDSNAIAGYVLKSRSPSCGLGSVPVEDGDRSRRGNGLFAATLSRRLPALPLAEDDDLQDPAALAQFLRRAFFYRRWRRLDEPLAAFHRRHRSLLLASGAASTRRLDRAIADGGDDAELPSRYGREALRVLRHVPSRRSHARNLGWVVGHLVSHVGDRQRRANVDVYRAYASGEASWADAAVVLRRSAEAVGQEAVLESAYLFPEPLEWDLLVRLDRLQTRADAPVN